MSSPSSPKPRRSLGLVARIMVMSVSGILVLGVCVTGVAKFVLERGAAKTAAERVDTNMRVAWDALRTRGSTFKIEDGKLFAGTNVLNGDVSVVDKIKTLVGGTATIFMKDTRIATNVMKPDGARATGTQLARSAAYESVIERKTPFRGEVTILGENYMTAYDPILDAQGDVLGILYVGIKKVEFLETANETLWFIIYATVGVMFLAIVANFIAARNGVARPLKASIAAMKRLAQGDLTVETPVSRRGDEIGEIMTALAVFKANGLEVERMKTEQSAVEQRAAGERQREMMKLADGFEGAVGQIVEKVSSASKELEASAGTLTSISERSQSLTVAVAASSEEASTNVQSVASATEEMSSSVNEISRRVQESARIANDAVGQASETNRRVGELATAASRIGDVVELINSIAGQTNLLALNATIEAARAGEAGRGFAVVAAEVKALAEQTAKATSEISQQINGIQAATQDSVAAIREIGSTIGQMSEIASAIASAVEEQGATTQEISRNVQQAAQGTMQVSANIADVQRGVDESGSAASQVLSAAQSLSSESTQLKLEVDKFLNSVRAA
ncbi:MAG: methyl-accepting chemotaxis sensory transducer [Tardiphaga sp.]|uniref:methyl-accepting chemotaxis protein n=1 Tax=Tardiphaga sp. TaxID=1926292 RepID=UPI002626B9FF|nr:cache domain-containing protein [Tardiphaga sp.]MDB5501190.1 methyl-accepting chemotaxis sensory transducer [Tardiphaga sp.]